MKNISRLEAIRWWNNLPYDDKYNITQKYYHHPHLGDRFPKSLTGREIEEIWKKETFKERLIKELEEQYSYIQRRRLNNIKKEEVDFEMLKETIHYIQDKVLTIGGKWNNNFQLFFKLLSTKPKFANIAYRKLNKLNK